MDVLFYLLGSIVTLNGVLVWLTSNFTLGNVLTSLLGAALLLYGALRRKLSGGWRIAAIAVFVVTVIFVCFLLLYGTNDNVTYEEDALIVLGAAVHGDRPSGILADRLDVAAAYCKRNPHAVIVVSGGQGAQEDITEALAMERYLLEVGVAPEQILKEEQATSTEENFRFSKNLLDKHFGGDYSAAFVTNEYHIYRSRSMARLAGFDTMSHLHSQTKWYSILPGTLRECLAVLKLWIL